MHMSKRAAKFISAIFASLLVGIPLSTVSHSAPEAAGSCLSKPKAAPPKGGHWYYRTDRVSKRRCWFLGDAKEKVSHAAPENSQQSASSVAPPNAVITQPSIANARAELPWPQTRVEPGTSVFAGPQALAAASPENSQPTNAGDADAQPSVVASRWFEPAGMTPSASPQPSADNSAARAQQPSEAAEPPAAAAVTLAAADPPSAGPSGSIEQLLIALAGALALAGLIASAIFRLGGAGRTNRRERRADRGVNWDSARTNRSSPSDNARGAASIPEIAQLPAGSLSRDPRTGNDRNERTAQMLARLARSART
jgi:hypothetical protein